MREPEPREPKTIRKGRRPRSPEPVSAEVSQLISIVETNPNPGHVQRWLIRTINRHLDDELEAMAVQLMSGWDPEVEVEHVKAMLTSGQPRRAINAIIAQVRKEVVAELRRHKRSEADDFLDSCIVE